MDAHRKISFVYDFRYFNNVEKSLQNGNLTGLLLERSLTRRPIVTNIMKKFHKDDIPQFIDWLKSTLALSSAGVGAIAFSLKPGIAIPTSYKWGVGFFFASTLLTLLSMLIVIQHKRSPTNFLSERDAYLVIISFIFFLAGMGSVAVYVLT